MGQGNIGVSAPVWTEQELESLRRLFVEASWSAMLAAIPNRNRSAINQKARDIGLSRGVNRRIRWTEHEDAILRNAFPTEDQEAILAALPDRKWANIGKRASDLKIHRPTEAVRKNNRAIHPIIKKLREERERQKIGRPELSKKLGYHVNQILGWEMGKTSAPFAAVYDWALALGLELSLRDGASRVLQEKTKLVPLHRLMGGRA